MFVFPPSEGPASEMLLFGVYFPKNDAGSPNGDPPCPIGLPKVLAPPGIIAFPGAPANGLLAAEAPLYGCVARRMDPKPPAAGAPPPGMVCAPPGIGAPPGIPPGGPPPGIPPGLGGVIALLVGFACPIRPSSANGCLCL